MSITLIEKKGEKGRRRGHIMRKVTRPVVQATKGLKSHELILTFFEMGIHEIPEFLLLDVMRMILLQPSMIEAPGTTPGERSI